MKRGPRNICCEPYCKNQRRKDRRRCHKCDCRRKRKANPMWSAWRALKDHAKERKSQRWPNGIPFHLKLCDFIRFAKQSGYLNRTGINGHCLTVDRIEETRGYFKNNVQPLTRIKNSEKKARQDKIRMKAGMKWQERYSWNSQSKQRRSSRRLK